MQIDKFNSQLLGCTVPYGIAVPTNGAGPFPVVYVLHGLMRYGPGSFDPAPTERDFYERGLKPDTPDVVIEGHTFNSRQQLADDLGVVLVMANGGASWYIDSPVIARCQYESHLVEELVPHIDALEVVQADAAHRMLVGHSMGGFGALRLLARHPDLFCGAGLRAASLRMMNLPQESRHRFGAMLGTGKTYYENWANSNGPELLDPLLEREYPIAISVGIQDSEEIINQNRRLRDLLKGSGREPYYVETEDGHNDMPWMWHLIHWAAGVMHAKDSTQPSQRDFPLSV